MDLLQILSYLLSTPPVIAILWPNKSIRIYLYIHNLEVFKTLFLSILLWLPRFHTCGNISDKQYKFLSCLVDPNIFFINLFYNSKEPCSSWGWGNKGFVFRRKHVPTVLNRLKLLEFTFFLCLRMPQKSDSKM
jgi:hypothetical protein